MKIKVFSAQSYDKEFLSRAAVDLKDLELVFQVEALTKDTVSLASGFDGICLFVNDQLDKDMILNLKERGLKLVLLRCAGFNNVCVETCVANGIRVMRVPTYSPEAVAEFAIASLLTLVRKVHKANSRLKDQNFALSGLLGQNLNGKVFGIIGTGAIGKAMCKIVSGFGCKVICFDVFPDKAFEETGLIKYVPLEELVSTSDFVSLHVPLLPTTKHLINEELLNKFKPNSVLVNTSRGALVDTRAIIRALQSKRLGGFAADVYEKEAGIFFADNSNRVLEDQDELAILNSMPNVLLTAHCAFFTHEAMTQIAQTVVGNAKAFLKQEPAGKNDVLKN